VPQAGPAAAPGRQGAILATVLRRALLLSLGGLVLAGAGCASGRAEPIRLARVAGGLDRPLLVVAPPRDARLFVVEQAGRVRVIERGRLRRAPFLDIRRQVTSGGEQGLLGLAFHPRFRRNGLFYVDYTDRAGDTRIVEYRAPAAGDRADPGSARLLLRIRQPYANHNGGHLVFGPDGMLYIGTGDGGSAGDPHGNGQRVDTLLGKILRLDVTRRSGGRPYAIPPGNPFARAGGGRPEIYHWGLRNPWRFSFDRVRGDLWIGDVGQNAVEEIDFRRAGTGGGANFGWNAFEGTRRFGGRPRGPTVPPVAQYGHALGCSVIGGFVYRGSRVRSLRGRYVFADYCSGRFWTLRAGPRPGGMREITSRLSVRLSSVTSFGEGAAGELYVTAGSAVYRLDPGSPPGPTG
jgi:glucose/arabinose dehydrogenase